MNMTPDLQKKLGAGAGFAVLAALVLYLELPHGSAPPPSAPVVISAPVAPVSSGVSSGSSSGAGAVAPVVPGNVVRSSAKTVGTTSAQLDPTLRMEAMLVTESVVYSGSGRNIFSVNSAPIDIPKPVASVRTQAKVPVAAVIPSGPPPPPPIDLKFFGTVTGGKSGRQALLLHGEDVFLASDGDIVQRKYKVITVSANSIVVEDMANSNRQTLPLLAR